MAKKEPTRQERYESSGKRPGKPISTRLTEPQMEAFAAKAAEQGMKPAGYLNALALKAIGWNEPAKKRGKK